MFKNRRVRGALFGSLMLGLAVSVTACGSTTNSTNSSSTNTAATNAVATNSSGGSSSQQPISVAFFGFASANSFAQATWKGVQKAATEANGTSQFFDGQFGAQTQVKQMKDALVSKKYNVWVVQANDGASVVPEVEQAVKDGISVVAEFTPIGTKYDTAQPQVPGTISFVDVPTKNGKRLGQLAIQACGNRSSCNVAYLQGNASLPLDNARTQAVLDELKTDKNVHVIGSYVGGYTQSEGMKVAQDLLTAHPDVNVIIGSSQAIEGVQTVLKRDNLLAKVKLVGNGGSIQAVDAVHSGAWFATYYIPETTEGYDATKYGIEHEQGKTVPMATDVANMFPVMGTQKALKNVQGQYKD